MLPTVAPTSAFDFCAAFTDLSDAPDHRFDFCSDFFAPLSVTLSLAPTNAPTSASHQVHEY